MSQELLTRRCLYTSARLEAERHAASSLAVAGAERAAEWNRECWWPWAAERYLEHVLGRAFWQQFGESDFSAVAQLPGSLVGSAKCELDGGAGQDAGDPDVCELARRVEEFLEEARRAAGS